MRTVLADARRGHPGLYGATVAMASAIVVAAVTVIATAAIVAAVLLVQRQAGRVLAGLLS